LKCPSRGSFLTFIFEDIEEVRAVCAMQACGGTFFDVEEVDEARQVRVTRFADSTTEESLRFYFENKQKSGGGEIAKVERHFEDDAFIVTFRHKEGQCLCFYEEAASI